MYAIDRSGSFSASKRLDLAKQEVVRNIRDFSCTTQFGVVFYDAGLLVFPGNWTAVPATVENKADAIDFVNGTLLKLEYK